MTAKRVLSVGQCAADHGHISRVFQHSFAAEVVGVDTTVEALEKLRRETFALVLVNRVFDADGASGLDFIKQVKSDEALTPTPVMLVSNYMDAQKQALEMGAAPGFGKAELGARQMIERLKGVLGD
jgi:two-component system, chemotaxis family, chemotaxis protein CheY